MAWVSQETEHFWSLEFITALAHLPVSSGRPRFVPYLTATPDLIFIVFILDRVGRRKPLLWGTIGITLALICEAIVNSQITRDDDKVIIANDRNNSLSIAGVFFIFSVSVIFSLSFGPISWVYMSEIMPMQIRARGNAFATGIGNWLVSTFWAQVSPTALKELSWKFYFLFVGMYPHPLSPGLTISDNDGARMEPRGYLPRHLLLLQGDKSGQFGGHRSALWREGAGHVARRPAQGRIRHASCCAGCGDRARS
jgi:MFS family permease